MVQMHSTDYTSAFIEVADDCKAETGTIPPEKGERTIARIHYDLISESPYGHTSDDVIFAAFAEKHGIDPGSREEKRREFFSKGQPCLRSSPLGKTYGWGIHFDEQSRVAIFGRGSPEYERYRADPSLAHLKAMKSRR
jgi:hypothetical protein